MAVAFGAGDWLSITAWLALAWPCAVILPWNWPQALLNRCTPVAHCTNMQHHQTCAGWPSLARRIINPPRTCSGISAALGVTLPLFFSLAPKVLLLCCSWGACLPRRSQRLCQLEFWLLVGTTMLDRLWARGQTKCNTPLMLATSVFGRIHKRPCYVMAQPKSRLDIPWPNDTECMGHFWYHFSCWYPLLFDVESLAGCVGG